MITQVYDKSKYPILISNPRMGTTFVSSYLDYLRSPYFDKHKGLQQDIRNSHWEFFRPNGVSVENKIALIETLQKNNFEIYIKFMCRHLIKKYKSKIVWDWMKKFYQDHTVVLLRRKNLWQAWISFIFHKKIRMITENTQDKHTMWHCSSKFKDSDLLNLIQKYHVFDDWNIFPDDLWQKFFDDVRFFETVVRPHFNNAVFLEYENCTDTLLKTTFGISLDEKVFCLPGKFRTVKYEDFIEKKLLKKMKDRYIIEWKNELKNYGYVL